MVLYENDIPIGCGAFKAIAADTVEVKRMYTLSASHRSKGHASHILALNWNNGPAKKVIPLRFLKQENDSPKPLNCIQRMGIALFRIMGNISELKTVFVFEKTCIHKKATPLQTGWLFLFR